MVRTRQLDRNAGGGFPIAPKKGPDLIVRALELAGHADSWRWPSRRKGADRHFYTCASSRNPDFRRSMFFATPYSQNLQSFLRTAYRSLLPFPRLVCLTNHSMFLSHHHTIHRAALWPGPRRSRCVHDCRAIEAPIYGQQSFGSFISDSD